jgi:hypothetical protein
MFSIDIFLRIEGGKGGWSYVKHSNSFINAFPFLFTAAKIISNE